MIQYSHVCLLIPCSVEAAARITAQLGVAPTRVREDKTHERRADGTCGESTHHAWTLDSPMGHADGDPTARLRALADLIEPIAERLSGLRPEFGGWIDVLYNVTPQHPHGVAGEFDWFQMPADLMRRYGAWDLSISYESIWFDHPDWVRPSGRSWWRRVLGSLGGS